jgi:hypothetical protein
MFAQGTFLQTGQETPEQIARKRQFIEGLMPRFGQANTTAEGLGHLAAGVVSGLLNRRLDKKESAGRQSALDSLSNLRGGSAKPGGLSVLGMQPYTPTEGQSVANDTIQTLVRQGLTERGLPPHVVEGALLNIQDESGFDPTINERSPLVPGSRGGYGLMQWTGPRRVALEQYAAERGASPGDLNTQLDFIVQEMGGSEANAGRAILSTKNPQEAASAWLTQYLRPAPENVQKRQQRYMGEVDTAPYYQALQNPFLTQEERQIVLGQLEEMQAAPLRDLQMQQAQMGLEKDRMELQQMQQPRPEYRVLSTQEVQQLGLPQGTYQRAPNGQLSQLAQPDQGTDDLKEYQFARQQGYQGTLAEFMRDMRAAGATTVNVGEDTSELNKKLDAQEATIWGEHLKAGAASSSVQADMQALSELISVAPQGPIQGRLAERFPGFSTAGSAFESIVKRVAPSLRTPGSGATSDIEYQGMLDSLPKLSNNPDANRAIAQMMRAKAQINMERAQAIQAYRNGDIPVQEARRALSEIEAKSIMTPEIRRLLGISGVNSPELPDSSQDGSSATSSGIKWRIVE